MAGSSRDDEVARFFFLRSTKVKLCSALGEAPRLSWLRLRSLEGAKAFNFPDVVNWAWTGEFKSG